MSCLLALSEAATQAEFDVVLAATESELERFAVIPDHLIAPEGLAAFRVGGVNPGLRAHLCCSAALALGVRRVVGDAVGVLELASVVDSGGAKASVVGPVSWGVRKALRNTFQEVQIL